MSFNNGWERLQNFRPYNFPEFLYAVLLFENPISIEKVENLLLEYNEKYTKRDRGINIENKTFPSEYIELTDIEYRLTMGITIETEVEEGTSVFKKFFLNTKPTIYDFLYEKYFDKQDKKASPYGKMMRDIKISDSARAKPILNDSLYRNHSCKEEIDLIRLAFYEVFGSDLKVIGSTYFGYCDSYLGLIENYYKFVPSSAIEKSLIGDSGIWIGFSKDRFNNERHTSFVYKEKFLDDQGFSDDYIGFCKLASRQIGGGDLNLIERNVRHDFELCHIEYQFRDLYSGPRQGEFANISSNGHFNRFIQYIASKTRSGDSQLGYIHYFDIELLKQILTEQEYKIVIEFIENWNNDFRKFYEQGYCEKMPNLEIGPNISYIRKRQ